MGNLKEVSLAKTTYKERHATSEYPEMYQGQIDKAKRYLQLAFWLAGSMTISIAIYVAFTSWWAWVIVGVVWGLSLPFRFPYAESLRHYGNLLNSSQALHDNHGSRWELGWVTAAAIVLYTIAWPVAVPFMSFVVNGVQG